MPFRNETDHPRVAELICGWFDRRRKYSAWRAQGTADWLLIYTKSGRGRFGFNGGEIITRPGDLTLLRPRTLHDYGLEKSRRHWELLWMHFNPRRHWLDWLNWPEVAPRLLRLQPDKQNRHRIYRRLEQVVTLAGNPGRQREQWAMNALEEALLCCDAINPWIARSRVDARLEGMMDQVCQALDRPHSLDSMADLAGLSVSRLAHLFREQLQTTPQQFVELQRINRARQLLELTGMSIKEISAEVGYENPFYFSRRFKLHTGESPRQFRQKRSSV